MSNFGGFRPPFTASQWQELEHQALIFKYLMAGLPVPLDLVIPIKKSFESISSGFFHQYPTMSYCSLYGKKADAEPGRCRRTDGKKWRCSKDAYPDSKYCDRHMHRGRTNRSRKPVEAAQNQSSTASSAAATALHAVSNPQGTRLGMFDPVASPVSTKHYKYHHGKKQESEEHTFLSDPSRIERGVEMDTSLETRVMPSYQTSLPQSKSKNESPMQLGYPEMPTLLDLGHSSIASAKQSQQHQYCFFGGEYGYQEAAKQHEGQSLRPFFNEWPKVRDPWSEIDHRNFFDDSAININTFGRLLWHKFPFPRRRLMELVGRMSMILKLQRRLWLEYFA